VSRLETFGGDFTLQTCFLRGTRNGETIDNTTEHELQAWYRIVERLRTKKIMIYVIDSATPVKTLEKIDRARMEAIAAPLQDKGYDVWYDDGESISEMPYHVIQPSDIVVGTLMYDKNKSKYAVLIPANNINPDDYYGNTRP
jgi:hypothetical protein